jgi:hypothetical protein
MRSKLQATYDYLTCWIHSLDKARLIIQFQDIQLHETTAHFFPQSRSYMSSDSSYTPSISSRDRTASTASLTLSDHWDSNSMTSLMTKTSSSFTMQSSSITSSNHKFPYLNVVILLLSFFFKPAFRSPNRQLNLVQLLLKPSNPCFHALWLHFKKLWIAHWMKINFFLSKANMMCHLAFIQHWKLNLMYELSHTYLYIDVQTISIV